MANEYQYSIDNFRNPYAAEDLSGAEGRGVYFDTTANGWKLLSDTDQDTTNTLGDDGWGILLEGNTSGGMVTVGVARAGDVYDEAIAGTGGVSGGDIVRGEYAASGLDRGRWITVADTALDPGDYQYGIAESDAAEDGKFRIQRIGQKVQDYTATP